MSNKSGNIQRLGQRATIEERISSQPPLDPARLTQRLYVSKQSSLTPLKNAPFYSDISANNYSVSRPSSRPLTVSLTTRHEVPPLKLLQANQFTPMPNNIKANSPSVSSRRAIQTSALAHRLPPIESVQTQPTKRSVTRQTARTYTTSAENVVGKLIPDKPTQKKGIYKPLTNPGSNVINFVESIHMFPDELDFVYAQPACGPFESLNPYDLLIIRHDEVDKKDYYTVSARGVTHFLHGAVDFTTLDEWEKERIHYNQVMQIPTFRDYRVWRAFSSWESYIRRTRITKANTLLSNAHYFGTNPLRETLQLVRDECYRFKETRLYIIKSDKIYSLAEFVKEREDQSLQFREKLNKFGSDIAELVMKTCTKVMDMKGFLKHESVSKSTPSSRVKAPKLAGLNRANKMVDSLGLGGGGAGGEGSDQTLEEALVGEMSYTRMAARRQECVRLTNFIREIDYMVLDTQHHLLLQATHDLLMSLKRCEGAKAPIPPKQTEMTKVKEIMKKKREEEEYELMKEALIREKQAEQEKLAELQRLAKKKKGEERKAILALTKTIQTSASTSRMSRTESKWKMEEEKQKDSNSRPPSASMSPKTGERGDEKSIGEVPYFSPFASHPKPPLAIVSSSYTYQTYAVTEPSLLPLLKTNLTLTKSQLGFSPSSEEMEQCLLDQVTMFLIDVCSLERLILNSKFRTYTSLALNESVTQQLGDGGGGGGTSGAETTSQLMDARCQEDKLFTQMRNDIRSGVSLSYQASTRHARYFYPFVCLLNGNISKDDVEQIEKYFKSIADEQKRLADQKEKERSESMGQPPKEERKEEDEEGGEKKEMKKVDEKELERQRIEQEKERERTWTKLKEAQGEEHAKIQPIDSALLRFIPSPPWFSDQLSRYNAQLADVASVDLVFCNGPFQISTETFKQAITPVIQNSVDLIRRLLPLISNTLRSNLYDEMRSAHLTLSSRPDSVEEYASVLAFLTIAQGEQDSVNIRFENIMGLYGVMKSFSIELPSSDQVNLSLFEKCNSQLRNSIIQTETQKEERIIHFSNNLLERVKDIHKDIAYVRNKINDPSLLVLTPNANDEYYEKMRLQCEDLQKEVQKINDEVNKNILYQGLFNVKEDKYEDLAQAKNESDCRTLLWSTLNSWEQLYGQWLEAPFLSLNADEINSTHAKYQKTANRLERELPPNQVVPKLKDYLVKMQMAYPVIYALRNKDLKNYHWVKIKDTIGIDQDIKEDQFTLQFLVDSGALDHRKELAAISDEASSEAILSDLLHAVQEKWNNMEFHTKQFHGDAYLLVDIDDLMRDLDDAIVQLATIRGSRNVGAIKEQVETWYAKLQSFAETLDVWLLFQQKWLSLEVVFQGDELLKDYSKKFHECDKFWRDMMKNISEYPNALRGALSYDLASTFRNYNKTLDEIQVALNGLLNTKRNAFGRFFFLPNDDLLDILKEGKNPPKVMPYMNKLFDNIKTLELTSPDEKKLEITAMISAEGENVSFGDDKIIPRAKPVEVWMKAIETSMVKTLRFLLALAIRQYPTMNRNQWILSTKAQHVLSVSQIIWTFNVEQALTSEKPKDEMKKLLTKCETQLESLTELVRGRLSPLERISAGALIVIDVHARDIVDDMIRDNVVSVSDFDWMKRLRYYWDSNVKVNFDEKSVGTKSFKKTTTKSGQTSESVLSDLAQQALQDMGDCYVRQTNSSFRYGYEFLGCTSRLVITPLTDQCYITLTSALHLKLGGSPAGPAGTGKTETCKDLAKAVARQCIVFNCSDGLNVDTMEQMFSGMCQAGAWFCFDEFNRIDIEVLSVVAQQIREIQDALQGALKRFIFQGSEIPLNSNCAVFITMNPGYAGRTELPDNLKALFRPVAMMIPDYALIAEIMLYSEGFKKAKPLSQKMVQLYKLSSEQLSQQRHYDFGMRAVKSVLVMAGQLRRDNESLSEDIVLIRAMRESNLPKFLADDVPLFEDIVSDLFPGAVVPQNDYGELMTMMMDVCKQKSLQLLPHLLHKTIELYDTFGVRHGVMLVGPTQGGKTACRDILSASLTRLREEVKSPNQHFQTVVEKQLNPKAISIDEMFGFFNELTQEWKEGLLSFFVSEVVKDDSPMKKWIIFDGPVDTLWIESLNTVLDDSKTLCLPNRKRIKLTSTVSLLFEVENLDVASPATVSRCGMVYIDPATFPWIALVQSWVEKFPPKVWNQERKDVLINIFQMFMDKLLDAIHPLKEYIHQPFLTKVKNVMQIMESYFIPEFGFSPVFDESGNMRNIGEEDDDDDSASKGGQDERAKRAALFASLARESMVKPLRDITEFEGALRHLFFFGVVWGVGGSLVESQYPQFDEAVKKIIDGVFMPGCDSIFDCLPDPETHRLTVWEVPEYKYVPNTPFFNILVPTNDTVRFSYIADRLIDINQPVLFMGETGVGKSVIAADMFAHTKDAKSRTPVVITFSAQTSSNRTQTMIESKLMNRRDHFAAAPNTTVVLFIDDFNMPAHDTFGSQPPLELLRQMLGTGGWYDRSQLQFRFIKGVTTMAACGPPGGGRNKVSERLTAMFTELSIPQPTSKSLNNIFQVILLGYIGSQTFVQGIKELVPSVVRAAVDLYSFTIKELRPTPSKSHYIFNLRDLSKVFQGMMQVTPPSITEEDGFVRLWAHESLRVFADRLTNDEDRLIFTHQIVDLVKHYIRINWVHDEMFVKEKQIIGIALQKEKEREQELEKEKLKKSRRRIPQSEEEQEEKKKKGGFNMWSSLSKIGSDLRPYEEIKDISKLQQSLANSLQDYNLDCVAKKTKEMDLEFFTDAMEHLARITRIIRQPRGNVLLVGVGGCGKQSLTRLASFIESYDCFEIQLAKNYGVPEFREDIRKLFDTAGVDDKPIVFLLSDAQIVQESFLEDINGILSSGEVPSLYDAQQRESIIQRIRQGAKENEKVPEHPDAVMSYMTQRVRKNLHIVLCMSPVGDSFRRRCRMFPSLVNCCTIDWVANWPDTALMSVAMKFLSDAPFLGGDNLMATRIAELCVRIHSSVEQASDRFYKENKRKTYVTPTLFLELIGLMFQLVKERSEALDERISKYESGVNTLAETKQSVADMQEELKKLEPILKQQHEQIKDLMEKIFVDQTKTSEIRATVQAEEAVVNVEAEKAKVLADEAQAELDKIMPVYLEANKALESLSKAAVTEVKTFGNPPEGVKRVMFAVCTLFGRKNDWDTARSMLSQTNFIQTLVYYKVEEIDEIMNKRMRPFIEDPDFKPDKLETVSKAAANICQWIVAIVEFARVSKIIEPKRKAAADAQAKLSDLQAKLAIKQKQLADVEEALLLLKQKFDAKKAECASTEAMIAQTEKRFSNATRLVSALGEEGERWAQSLEEAKQQKNYVLGDSLLSAGYLSYMGPYTTQYRQDLGHVWMEHFKELEIPYSLNFQLEKVLSSPVQIRDWGIQGLPSDQLSVENAVLVTRTRRWPLMIDPQGQANRWIRSKERENKLRVMRPNENHFLRTIINSIRVGQPILLEDVGETLDPQISPLLLQQTVKQGGRTIIRLGNQDIDYNPSFRLFLTTKLANPHYLPDIFIKVNIINFTVTSVGLEDQLLGDVVRNEKAELEEEKDMLVRSMAVDAKLLVDTETKILALLKGTSVQQILDDPSLINTLEQAKNTSSEIMKRVKSSEITDQQLQAARNEYRPMAIRGSVLYFTIVDLAVLDPMYQYSLQYFVSIFSLSLTQTPPYPTLEERLSGLINALTELIYMNVCRGLFETHRLLFSLMITAQISRREGKITNKEWDVFLRGPSHSLAVDSSTALSTSSASLPDSSSTTTSNPTYPKPTVFTVKTGDVNRVNDIPYFTVSPKNPAFPFEGLIDPRCWAELCFMDEKWNLFSGITTVMTTPENVPLWTAFLNKNTPTADKFPDQRFDDLSPFQKLLFIRVISPKSLTKCAMEYVKQSIGETFVQSPPLDLSKAHGDSSKSIPIIFVLSTGADPTQLVVRFAKEKGYSDKLSLLSLGQGQGPIAVKLLEKATMEGNWVFLQNCHLAASWMPELERICLSYLVAETSPKNPNFRLWLSAMPTSSFPIAVLQNGIKLTNEPPKGVRSNVLRSLRTISPDLYENACSYSPFVWRRILFGLAFFHSLIQERRKFGPLGWNIVYEFNDSDFEVSHNHLKMYLNEEAERNAAKEGDDYVFKNSSIPWKALKYLTGTVNYGGRVTDNWDKRTLAAVLAKFYVEEIAEEKPFLLGPAVKGGKEKRDEEVDTNVGGGEEKEGDMPVGEAEVDPETAAAMATEREENRINPYILRNLKTHADAVAFADKFPSTEEPEVFGMHDNAELALQLSEASKMILCMTMMQPRRTAPSGEANTVEKKEKKEEKEEGKKEEITAQGPDREVLIIIQGISAKLPGQLQRSEGKEGVLPQLITRQMMSAVSLQSITEKPTEVLSQPTSLSVVLSQEMVRFNKLLGVITESIAEVERAIAGLVVMSQDIEQVYDSILFGHVPQKWADAAYPSLKPLGGWVIDLVERVNFFRKWLTTGTPKCYWFSGFFFPQGFLTAILQTFARKYKCPIDILNFKYAALKESKEEVKNPPSDGVYVYGLFMEAGRWDMNTMELTEPTPGEMYATMPVLHFLPQQNYSPPQTLYAAPLYKTGARYGVLSTTGHSTNFVTAVTLPTSLPPQHWVLRGTALLCQQNE